MGSSESKLVREAKRAEDARLLQEFKMDFARFMQEALIFDELSQQSLFIT